MAKKNEEIKIKGLFEKFGEFDSASEINRAAKAQLEQGDIEAVKAIAKENGIDEMDAEDFINGGIPELCTPFTAAIGKLDAEAEALKLPLMMQMWKDTISGMLADDDGERLMLGIRRKDKRLAELFGKMIVEASHNRVNTPQAIVDYARQIDKSIPQTLPTADLSKTRFAEIVREYYLTGLETETGEVAPVQQEAAAEEAPEAETEEAQDPEDVNEDTSEEAGDDE